MQRKFGSFGKDKDSSSKLNNSTFSFKNMNIDTSLNSFNNSKKHLTSPRSLNKIDQENAHIDKEQNGLSWNIDIKN